MEPVHRSLTAISVLRSNLGLESGWDGSLEVRGFFDATPTVSAAVWISDWINCGLAHVRVPGGERHMFAMFFKDRLNEAAHIVLRNDGLGLMGPSACWNIGQKLSMLPNGGLGETLVFHNIVERGKRHWEAVMALRYTISAAMHQWLLERRAAGLPSVRVEPEIDDFMSS